MADAEEAVVLSLCVARPFRLCGVELHPTV